MDPKKIISEDHVLAIFFEKSVSAHGGIRFFTPNDYPLQIGLLEHAKGRHVPAHIHRNLEYTVNTAQEYIYVEKGENIRVIVYTNDWKEVEKFVMSSGDSVLFVSGGHELDIPANCRLIEIKQGPYPGETQAKYFRDSTN